MVDLSRAARVRYEVVEGRQGVMGQGQELLAEGGEDHTSRAALEELGSETRLERGDGGGHSRLGDREVVRSGAEVSLVGDSGECAKLDDGRISHKVNLSVIVDFLLCSIALRRAK